MLFYILKYDLLSQYSKLYALCSCSIWITLTMGINFFFCIIYLHLIRYLKIISSIKSHHSLNFLIRRNIEISFFLLLFWLKCIKNMSSRSKLIYMIINRFSLPKIHSNCVYAFPPRCADNSKFKRMERDSYFSCWTRLWTNKTIPTSMWKGKS